MFKFKIILLLFLPLVMLSQNEKWDPEKLKQDLTIFKEIREKANSGL